MKSATAPSAAAGATARNARKMSEFHQIRLREYRREYDKERGAVVREQTVAPFFTPTLVDLCAEAIAENFANLPEADSLREHDEALYRLVLHKLPPDVPLSVTVPRVVSDEPYWRAACETRWSAGQLAVCCGGYDVQERTNHGGWKRVCLERSIEDYLLSLTSSSMTEKEARVLADLCALSRDFVFELHLPHLRTHLDLYDQLVSRLPQLRCLHYTYDSVTVGSSYQAKQHQGFTEADALSVKEVLRRCGGLTTLRLPRNRITTTHFRAIAAGLVANSTLTSLQLSRNELDDNAAALLAVILEANTPPLRELDLQDNNIGSDGVIALCASLKKSEHLVSLNLHHNRIDDRGGAALFAELADNDTLETLIVSCNLLGNASVMALAGSLGGSGGGGNGGGNGNNTTQNSSTLQHLDLSGNTDIGSTTTGTGGSNNNNITGVSDIEGALMSVVSSCPQLTTFGVRFTGLTTDAVLRIERVAFDRKQQLKNVEIEAQEATMRAEVARYVELRVMKTHGV